MKLGSKGFSFVEMIAVIAVISFLLLIAIPVVSRIVEQSRKQAYIDSVIIQSSGNRINLGKDVLLISDMYLTESQLRFLLSNIDNIFSSLKIALKALFPSGFLYSLKTREYFLFFWINSLFL